MEKEKDYIDISSSSKRPVSHDAHAGRPANNSRKAPVKRTAPQKKKSNATAVRVISIVLAVFFALGGTLCYLGDKFFNRSIGYEALPDANNYQSETNDSGELINSQFEIDTTSTNLLNDPYVLNVMLFGADKSGDEGLSDTMILLSIDNRHKKIKLTSFLRDTYISIPGVTSHKLNYAYAVGGAALSIQTIEANYGIQIDRYATVNFTTFKEIVDIMGGIELYLTDEEILYINCQMIENGQTGYLDATEGMVRVNGQQALWYARNRGGTYNGVSFYGDDWDRTDRQRKFIEAVINNVKDASLSEIIQIINKVGPMITTNLKKTEIESLVMDALTYLKYDIEQCSMPSQGTWSYGWNEAGSVILVDDWNGARYDLATFIYEESVTG